MTKAKNTKRALLASVLSMMLCMAMLVGSTFAWFTDSVTSGKNKIVAGNLDVELYHTNGNGTEEKVDGATNLFVNADGSAIKWEPGVMVYENFTVKNVGSLALKYKLTMNVGDYNTVKDTDKSLKDVLKVAVLNEAFTGDRSAAQALTFDKTVADFEKDGNIAAGAEGDTYAVVIYWEPSDVDNDYNLNNGKKSSDGDPLFIDLGINLVATQDTVESDSFDNQYDKNAVYPDIAYVNPSTQEDMNAAIQNPVNALGESVKEITVSLPTNKTVTLDNGIANESNNNGKGRDVTFIGNGTQTVDIVEKSVNAAEGNEMNYQRGSSFTFENVDIVAGTSTYGGIVCDALTFKNCTITGKLTLYGKAEFIDCTFNNTMEDQYSIWTWGGTDVKFEGCTFNTNGKAILLYGTANTNLTVNNCTFNDRNNGSAEKAAIEIGNDYGTSYTLVVNTATVNGFAINPKGENTNSTIWANKNSMDAEHLSVTIDGTKVH